MGPFGWESLSFYSLSVDEFANHKVILNKCLELDKSSSAKKKKARQKKLYQTWSHSKGGQIRNEFTNLCLSTEGLQSSDSLRTVECNQDDQFQIFWFQKYNDLRL